MDVNSSWRTNFKEAQTDRHQFQNVDVECPEERRPGTPHFLVL